MPSLGDGVERTSPTARPTEQSDTWPVFRGDAASTGVAHTKLPDKPVVLWKKTYKNGGFEGTAAIVGGMVYVGSFDGNLYALDLADGGEKWKFHTELGFKAAPAVRDGTIYIGDVDGKFYAIDARHGTEIWSTTSGAEINAGANFYRDKILFTSQDGGFYCLSPDGKLVWKYTIDNMIQCSPTVVENRGFLAGCDGKLHIVDLDKGEAVATVDISDPTLSTPAAEGDLVYFGTQGGRFLAVDWRQAKIVWTYDPKRNQPLLSSAAVAGGLAVFGGKDRSVHAVQLKEGDEAWSFRTHSAVDSSPVVVGNRAYIGGGDGRLYALDLASGKKVWEYEAGGRFSASAAVAQGRLVIGNDAGDLYCFGAK
ncbi:MAG TPA: PQQ-binding-like beta-propeller repeat protein [Pirellulales bacterium]|jgi:outer membrane protein assembly factor BamB|nr:PQQ-binding-like beta-propeller repeat protein [Pirellulales bacterium]